MEKVLIVSSSNVARLRIKEMLEQMKKDVKIAMIIDEQSFQKVFTSETVDYKAIILSIRSENDLLLDILGKHKHKLKKTDVFLITPVNSKSLLIKAIGFGISEYILDPYTQDTFTNKILPYLETGINTSIFTNQVVMDVKRYLSGEIKKSLKGKYELSLVMGILSDKEGKFAHQEEIFEFLSRSFWDTDVLIKYSDNSYLGVLPFCGKQGIRVVSKKLIVNFNKYKEKTSKLINYDIEFFYVTLPEDGMTKDELIEKLIKSTKK